jgi:tetratricopeptide (TPR) repeat protein
VAAGAVVLIGCSSAASGPKSADKLVNDGLRAQQVGNLGIAIQDYEAAIKANPQEVVAYYDLGVIYQNRGDTTDAASAYQKALLINPRYKSALFNLAILDTATSPSTAVSLYQQLNSFDPKDPNVLLNLGLLLRQLGQKSAAAADLAQAVKLKPSFASQIPPASSSPTSRAPTTPTSPPPTT